MDAVLQILGVIGGIAATIATIVTGYFTYRVRMRKAEDRAKELLRSEDAERAKRIQEREDAFNKRVDKTLADMQARCDEIAKEHSQLQALYGQALIRLDTLERQRERDVMRIKELEQKVLALGGTI